MDNSVPSWKIFNAWHLKLIMAGLMLLDHLRIIEGLVPPDVQAVFTIISRCVAPVFAFLVVEGIIHTRNLSKYIFRLFICAIAMAMGNAIIENTFKRSAPGIELSITARPSEHMMFLTFALGALCVGCIIWGLQQKGAARGLLYIVAAVSFYFSFSSEWGTVVAPFIVVTYFFRDRKLFKWIGYALIEALALFRMAIGTYSEPLYFIGFPFIALYNGQRGPNNPFTKYFFYIFYPAHVWILCIVNFLMAGG